MKTTTCNDPSCGNNSCDCTHGACPCIDRTKLLYEVAEKHSPFPSVLVANEKEPDPGSPCNDEFWDGTDGACPAWWRGADDGVEAIVRGINRVLDRYDKGDYSDNGHFGSEDINKLVERIKKLYTKEG